MRHIVKGVSQVLFITIMLAMAISIEEVFGQVLGQGILSGWAVSMVVVDLLLIHKRLHLHLYLR